MAVKSIALASKKEIHKTGELPVLLHGPETVSLNETCYEFFKKCRM